MERHEDRFFLALVAGVTIALLLLLEPFFGAIIWAIIAALLFGPANSRLIREMGGRRNTATSITLLMIVLLVVAPAILLGSLMLREVTAIYQRLEAGHFDPRQMVLDLHSRLPSSLVELLDRLGLSDFGAMQERLAGTVTSGMSTLAGRALDISQSVFGFLIALGVMLYLSFFLLRDGNKIAGRLESAIPLQPELRRSLLDKIATVIRATIKGSLVVAVVQGLIGGVVFWALGINAAVLWGTAMGFLSLLPAVGTGLVWVPVAIYLLVTGAVWKGVVLIFCGVFVIGLVDNLLRPILVGRDTRMPDYMVLISTLGGLQLFGFNGIVVGPVIAALFMAVWEVFAQARSPEPE